jgi:hypothetical protein
MRFKNNSSSFSENNSFMNYGNLAFTAMSERFDNSETVRGLDLMALMLSSPKALSIMASLFALNKLLIFSPIGDNIEIQLLRCFSIFPLAEDFTFNSFPTPPH